MALGDALTTYFEGEKTGGLVLAVLGAAALGWGAMIRRGDLRGMFWPFALVGALQLAVGVGLYTRTDRQVAGLRAQMERSQAEFLAAETPRMQRVQRNFVVIEGVELAVLLVGVALALGFKERPMTWGVGVGLALQATVMLAFDLVAERRGALWLAALLRGAAG